MGLLDIYLKARETAEQVFIKRKLGDIADTGDGDGIKQGLPMFSSQEKGNRNKRKFLSEFSLDPSSNSSSLKEFPRYEVLEEKYKQVKGVLDSMGEMSGKGKEELDWSKFAEWKDPMIPFIEDLILKELTETYSDAIKKVVENGYSMEMAECAVLRRGSYFGAKSLLLNIVDGALNYLKGDKEIDTSKGHMFEDLENLVEYTMLEMTCILKEVNPALSVMDAMWALLIFDMNLVKACSAKGDLHKFLMDGEVLGEKSTDSSSTLDQKSELTVSDPKSEPNLPIFGSQLAREVQKNEKESGVSVKVTRGKSIVDTKENIKAAVEAALMEGISKKEGGSNSKRELLRQKKFYFEKNNKGRLSKGAFKAKVTSLGGPVMEKKPMSPSDGVSPKNSLTEAKSETQMPMPQEKEKSTQNTQVNTASPPKTVEDYCAGIPFDEAQGKYVAQDGKDEIILATVARMEALQKEVESWNDWANEKVMQVARRLRKDQAELKALRLEKEELDKLIKEKQMLEENTEKRLSEMENALHSAMGQVALADSTACRFVMENSALKVKMLDLGKKGYQESVKLEEATLKEKETLKKCQAIEPEKALLQEELTALKCKTSALQQGLEKPKAFINQFEVQRAYEEREKNKVLQQIENIKKEKEHIEAVAKAEEERIEEDAKKELQKHKEDMRKMEEEISGLKLETEARKIAELRKSASLQPQRPKESKRLPVFRNNFGGGTSLKQERECVMCLTEEMSVIFLPCAHQVLCVDCNVIHEKQGMKECPSCRTPIQMRFNARFTP